MHDEVKFREAQPQDINQLYKLIKKSTKDGNKLTEESLFNSLFGWQINPTNSRQTGVNFDSELVKTNNQACSAFVAESSERLVGYAIFHFHYSPWLSHSTYVNGIYIEECPNSIGNYAIYIISQTTLPRS